MSAESDFQLCRKDGFLTLIKVSDPSLGAVSVDFDDKTMAWRQRHPQQPEALLKAAGMRAGHALRVIDATAGLGQDAFMLANAGCDVLMLERSALLHALLEDGLQRAAQSEDVRVRSAAARMQLVLADSTSIDFATLGDTPDVIYLDPMFPERRKKSAKVKKNMFMLQQLLDDEPPADGLLLKALQSAQKRVVVKRPRIAGFLEERKPSFQLLGSSSRFDVYLTQPTSRVSTSS
jgi:16S rRNA (guanine1516-N2)-methyltransferase